MRKPRVGLFLISPERFQKIGDGTSRGSYLERKQKEAVWMAETAGERFDVTFTGVIYNADDTRKAIRKFVEDQVDCVKAVYLSWAEDFCLNRLLRDLPPMPVLYGYRMRDSVNLGDTHDDDEFAEYLCCGGLVGSLEGSGDVARYDRPMLEIAVGTWEKLLDRMSVFANAARARAELKEANIGLLACYNEVMWSTYVDPYKVFKDVGPEINFLSVAELWDEVEAVSEEEAEAVVKRLSETYAVKPDVDHDKFVASVRATIAMERMAEKHKSALIVLNDIDTMLFKKVGLRPGFYPTNEAVDTVIVPEGDIGLGLAAYFLKLLGGKHMHVVEPFHMDLPSDTFEGGHAGPNDYTAPGGKTQISRDVRFAKTPWKHAGAPFAWHVFPEGRMTMLHISQHNEKFVMVVTLVESLPQEAHLATYTHGRFRPVGQTCEELFEKLLKIGVTQHYALTLGDKRQEVLTLGRMLGFECYEL